jgi:hypothetical protein
MTEPPGAPSRGSSSPTATTIPADVSAGERADIEQVILQHEQFQAL